MTCRSHRLLSAALLGLLLLALVAGCSSEDAKTCKKTADCFQGETCLYGHCIVEPVVVEPIMDAGDGGSDVGRDTETPDVQTPDAVSPQPDVQFRDTSEPTNDVPSIPDADPPVEEHPIRAVSTGQFHSCLLKSDDSLWCWGANFNGSVGDGGTIQRQTPIRIRAGDEWRNLRVGSVGSCATQVDDTLWCWGNNNLGQLGDGTSEPRHSPTQEVLGRQDWVNFDIGTNHACGVTGQGTLFCWGQNSVGQLGNGEVQVQDHPQHEIPNSTPGRESTRATNWKQVSTGWRHTCAVRHDGTLWCWGDNEDGQLGVAMGAPVAANPTRVGLVSDWTSVHAGSAHTCAIQQNGNLHCWGSNVDGQLGESAGGLVGEARDWMAASLGRRHTCGIRSVDGANQGTLWCWGSNTDGLLGLGHDNPVSGLRQVGSRDDWVAISSSTLHSCGATADGAVWCWGFNGFNHLWANTEMELSPREIPVP